MREMVDVLIVGGGPAGLATAQTAAAKGKAVLVVHRDREIGKPVRTSGGSWKRDLDRLGLPEDLYQPMETLTLAGPRRTVTTRFGEDRPVVLDVTRTYRYLAELARQAGASVECGVTFKKILSHSSEGVECLLTDSQGERRVSARFVVDASGHARAVLSALGTARKPERIGLGIEYEYENHSTDPKNAVLIVGNEYAPSGYGWIFPTAIGTVRVGIGVLRPDSNVAPYDLLERFMASRYVGALGLGVGQLRERHTGVIPSDGLTHAFVHGRVVAVGDSVNQALPLVGEGIRYCIAAGRKAGTALRQALDQPSKSEEYINNYIYWWKRTYGRPFSRAQWANERIARYTDRNWEEKLDLLSLFDGNLMAAFLRMELTPTQVSRLAVRRPLPFSRYLVRRYAGRFHEP